MSHVHNHPVCRSTNMGVASHCSQHALSFLLRVGKDICPLPGQLQMSSHISGFPGDAQQAFPTRPEDSVTQFALLDLIPASRGLGGLCPQCTPLGNPTAMVQYYKAESRGQSTYLQSLPDDSGRVGQHDQQDVQQ